MYKESDLHLLITEVSVDETKYETLYSSLMFNIDLVIIMFDLTDMSNFSIIEDTLKKIQNCNSNSCKLIIGNKLDNVNGICTPFDNFCKNKKLNFFELSLQTKTNVNLFYQFLSKSLKDRCKKEDQVVRELEYYDKPTALGANANYKIILVGDSSVGKSCFFSQYFKDEFIENNISTLGFENQCKVFKVGNQVINCQVWDTAGQERFRSSIKSYYKNTDGIILMYDVTQQKTLDNISGWIRDISDNTKKSIVIFLVANKIDNVDETVVSWEEASTISLNNNLKCFQTSARLNINVADILLQMVKDISTVNKSNHQSTTNLNKEKSKGVSTCAK